MRRCAVAVGLAAAVPLLALASCSAPHSVSQRSGAQRSGSQHKGPLADEDVKTTFAFLASRYDGNADGAIEPAEYARNSEVFAKLDANADGKLTPEDFPAERWERDLGIRDIPADARARLRARYEARAVVLAYFRAQSHSGDPALTRDALADAFARVDRDASGALDEAEFARVTAARPWGGPGEAWSLLRAAIDVPPPPAPESAPTPQSAAAPAQPDGLVALDEMLRYHEAMAGADKILKCSPGVDPFDVGGGFAGDGPPRGSLAPDFELAPPAGGARVRLSAWRGKKPVALIFGSYT